MGVWVAIAALAFTVLTTVGAVSFFFGQVFERLRGHHARLRDLEDGEAAAGGKTSTLRDEVIRLGGEVLHFGDGLRDFKTEMREQVDRLSRAVEHAEAMARNAAGTTGRIYELGTK